VGASAAKIIWTPTVAEPAIFTDSCG
jgi:tetratricopeptide (TPR) repeat protein